MLASTLLDRCWIHDRAMVSDGAGGVTEVFTRRVTPTPCRFGPLNDYDLSATANTTFGASSAAVSLPHDTVIDEGDHIEAATDGSMWLVTGRLTPPSVMATSMRVLVREL